VDYALDNAPDGSKIVFADVRFPNEGDAIRALGGKIIRINRPGVGPVNGHTSETAMDNYPYDVILENVSDVEGLRMLMSDVLVV
jgi:hypothetical protein